MQTQIFKPCSIIILIATGAMFSSSTHALNGKGMTWGFVAFSDIRPDGVNTQCPQTGIVKLGCNTSSGNTPRTNYCGSVMDNWPWTTPKTDLGSRMCDAYKGDTACTKKLPILCISEPDNPYLQRKPPYNNPNAPQAQYWPLTPPPYHRPRYKIHHGSHAMPKEFYAGWVDQLVKLSRPVKGTQLTSPAAGDQLCGPGWRMAEFHDGRHIPDMDFNVPGTYGNAWNTAQTKPGGWSFHAALAPDANFGPAHPGDSGMNRRTNFMKMRYWVKSNTTKANCWD